MDKIGAISIKVLDELFNTVRLGKPCMPFEEIPVLETLSVVS